MRIRTWMRIVGIIYILLGIGFIPMVNEARAPYAFPFTDGAEETLLFGAFIDYSFAFGIDLLVMGGFLLWATRDPDRYTWLVWLVVWLEGFRVVGDLWTFTRPYPGSFQAVIVGFIVLHLIIVVTGVRILHSGEAELSRDGV